MSSCLKLLLNSFLVLIGQCFYCSISNVKKNIGRTIIAVHCVKLSKKKVKKKRKEEGKKRREKEKVVKASEHVVVYRHTYTKYKAEVESISKNEVLV